MLATKANIENKNNSTTCKGSSMRKLNFGGNKKYAVPATLVIDATTAGVLLKYIAMPVIGNR